MCYAVNQFVFDPKESDYKNFLHWLPETNYERWKNGDREYTVEEGKKVFNSLFAVNLI
jgi:hypothetical protein